MLACAAVTGRDVRELAGEWVTCMDTVEPREAWRAWYDDRFAAYREVYPALRGLSMHRRGQV